MKEIALSKTLHPDDFGLLSEELELVDKHFETRDPQHPMRRWEYALALRTALQACRRPSVFYDVGGYGSPFMSMVLDRYPHAREGSGIVDPKNGGSLSEKVVHNPQLADVVTCISVLEHIPREELSQFLYHLSCLVAPGGILFLTVDSCNCAAHSTRHPEQHHFHWMRQQIFTLHGFVEDIVYPLLSQRFNPLGRVETVYHGDQVYDYTFRSYALVKDR